MDEQEYMTIKNLAHIQDALDSVRKIYYDEDRPGGTCGVGISKNEVHLIMNILSKSETDIFLQMDIKDKRNETK